MAAERYRFSIRTHTRKKLQPMDDLMYMALLKIVLSLLKELATDTNKGKQEKFYSKA